ncbi:sigma-54-dependent transcriptional regulator [Desulforapulum autotrophicum]|uniref:sigma-54-dependent transcriptional regulator n=1 Tax=Desulforapulum autotrophicum TaxID=2296 RepID=UPI0002D6099D|nr:sigma-54 dependent transcriptional regulator [Desulforapulum autotrophicum]
MTKFVLIVDDEAHILTGFSTELKYNGIKNIITCDASSKVMEILDQNDVGMVFLDLMMPEISGREILARITEHHPHIPVVVVTASSDVDTAVACMRQGAHDFLSKPVEPGRLASVCRHTMEYAEMKFEINRLSTTLLDSERGISKAFDPIVTRNKAMESIFRYVESIASTSQPLFITGETGTGKDLIARAAHEISQRQGKFVKINAAGLDDAMFSDTLFGHAKGAYTGADSVRPGLVKKAGNGTLFLDEIGDLSVSSQVKLLGLIQDREYLRTGDDRTRYSDARIIAATNLDSKDLSNSKKFRRDLYFRLMTHHVHLPPLRNRPEDIAPLVNHFVQKACQTLDRDPPAVDNRIFKRLIVYPFPGNVRELEAMVFDGVSTCMGNTLDLQIFEHHMASAINGSTPGQTGSDLSPPASSLVDFSTFSILPTLKQACDLLVNEAIQRSGGNQAMAARMLGISRQALNRRIKQRAGPF